MYNSFLHYVFYILDIAIFILVLFFIDCFCSIPASCCEINRPVCVCVYNYCYVTSMSFDWICRWYLMLLSMHLGPLTTSPEFLQLMLRCWHTSLSYTVYIVFIFWHRVFSYYCIIYYAVFHYCSYIIMTVPLLLPHQLFGTACRRRCGHPHRCSCSGVGSSLSFSCVPWAQDTPHDFILAVTWPCSYLTLHHVNWNSFIIIIIVIIIIYYYIITVSCMKCTYAFLLSDEAICAPAAEFDMWKLSSNELVCLRRKTWQGSTVSNFKTAQRKRSF